MNEDDMILKEYKEAFRKYSRDGIIDLDNLLKFKFKFQIHRLENVVSELEGVVPPSRLSQYYITLIKKGTGQKSIGNFNFSIGKNTLLCIPKRVMHSSRYWSLECSGYVLSFDIDFFTQKAFPRQLIIKKKIFKNSIRPYLFLSFPQMKKLETIFEFILREYKEGFNTKNELIAVKILELMIQCDRFYDELISKGNEVVFHETLEKFNELLEKNFSGQRSVQFYADELHIHPNHLNYLIKKHSGLSAKETINQHILNEAKYLLTSSSLSIKEVACKLGFENPEYFNVFFRRALKIPPTRYRNSLV
jgi:AraC family transcriptional regulator, transcriptional activator of pobA